jgi:hypothetical protein
MTEAAIELGAAVGPWLLSGLAVAACGLELRFRYRYGPLPFDDVAGPMAPEEAEGLLPRLEGAAPRGPVPTAVTPAAPRLSGPCTAVPARRGAYHSAA